MALLLDILNTYYLVGLWKGLSPNPTFFRDRYFPTAAGDIYKSDKVLAEYQDGDNLMAPFMVQRAEPLAVARQGYEIHEYSPTAIMQKRMLTLDDLQQRGFGEAILSNSTQAERAQRLIMDDLETLNRRFDRSEEWLCSQTIINNGFTVDEMVTEDKVGNTATVRFYGSTNDGLYTVGPKWDAAQNPFQAFCADVRAMCRTLAQRGEGHSDLLLGIDVIDWLLTLDEFRKLVDKNSGIYVSDGIRAQLTQYDGVTYYGKLNIGGYVLDAISVDEQYKAKVNGTLTTMNYFPADSVCVTAPGAGHLMYAQITQIQGQAYQTIAEKRVPRLFVDERHDTREIWLRSRPFAAPKNYSPWVYAPDVIG